MQPDSTHCGGGEPPGPEPPEPTHLGSQTADQVISEPDLQRHTVPTAVRLPRSKLAVTPLLQSGHQPNALKRQEHVRNAHQMSRRTTNDLHRD
jgi:hypothetical protein